MNAVWYEENGSTQVLKFDPSMPIPPVKAGHVLVRVRASGVNPVDTQTRRGWGGWDGTAMPFDRIIPHSDGAGVIEQVGDGVPSHRRIGERVWIYEAQWDDPFGTAAEYVVVPHERAVSLPDDTTFAQGACLGVPAMTAHRAVFGSGPVKDQTILVTGGAGAVGYYAIQLAKWGGAATVITTVSRPEQAALAKTAGADFIINYKSEQPVAARIAEILGAPRGVDRVVDVNFEANLATSEAVLKSGGVIATYASANEPEAYPSIPFTSLLMNNITIQLLLIFTIPEEAKKAAVRDITTALSEGALKHNIAKRYTLSEVAGAHDDQESGKMMGKLIIEL
jgi:NADPH:quinone reductase